MDVVCLLHFVACVASKTKIAIALHLTFRILPAVVAAAGTAIAEEIAQACVAAGAGSAVGVDAAVAAGAEVAAVCIVAAGKFAVLYWYQHHQQNQVSLL